MDSLLLFIDFEIESCEKKIDEQKNEIARLALKERMRAFKEVKDRLERFSKLVSDKPSNFIQKLSEYKEKCICNDISKHQIGGFCRACHKDF